MLETFRVEQRVERPSFNNSETDKTYPSFVQSIVAHAESSDEVHQQTSRAFALMEHRGWRRDARMAVALAENAALLHVLQTELQETEKWQQDQSVCISTLEQDDAEMTSAMSKQFQKSAQMRLDIKQARLNAVAQEIELASVNSKMATSKESLRAALSRIAELEAT